MEPRTVDQQAEEIVRSLSGELTTPKVRECLACYVARMITEFGCDCTLRFALRFRDLRAPRATALARRLGQMGGHCDCEIFLNGLILREELASLQRGVEPPPTFRLPPCHSVRAGSTQPCGLWTRLPRYGWW